MENAPPPHDSDPAMSHLVEALNGMRDALVNASLMLQDHQFDVDTRKRLTATEHSNALMEKINAK